MLKFIFGLTLLLVCVCQPVHGQFRKTKTIAGNGATDALRLKGRATEISLTNPFGIQPDGDGNLFIVSFDQHVLYRLDSSYTTLEVIAGSGKQGLDANEGGRATDVALNAPHEVQVDSQGNILVADTMNHRVGLVEAASRRWKVLAGTGQAGFAGDGGLATEALLNQAYSIALDGEQLFIADLGNHRIRCVDLRTLKISTLCGTGEKKSPTSGGLAIEQALAGPRSLAVDKENIWIVLREGNSVWRIDRSDNRIYHVAGTGMKGFAGDGGDARLALFNGPKGIAVDPDVAVYIADTENHAIRRIDLSSGNITTVLGSPTGQPGFNRDGDEPLKRLLSRPHGVCLLKTGELVVGDSENHRVRLLLP